VYIELIKKSIGNKFTSNSVNTWNRSKTRI